MSKSKKNQCSSLMTLLNDNSDQTSSSCSIPYACGSFSDNASQCYAHKINLDRNVDLSIIVHLNESEKSVAKINKSSDLPRFIPGFIIKVQNIDDTLRRNSISLPTGLNDRELEALRFHSHIPDGGAEYENLNKSCNESVSKNI